MKFRFGPFELDENRRELRLERRVIDMQPRVFDVLLYLVRNQGRVVPKEELLSAVWPDVIVTDSSLMRAVSLVRAILREGGEAESLRTYSRKGYRFICEPAETAGGSIVDRELALARAASERADWRQALAAFQAIRDGVSLTPRDLEQWAHAALYVGQPNDAIYPLERAVAVHSENADRLAAARAALKLANLNVEGRAMPVAKGWHRRAGALLADEIGETHEHGLYRWLAARIALVEGSLATALEEAQAALALGRRIQDPDVEALGLVYTGTLELATGETRSGLVHLDEAGAATLTGGVSPWVSGVVFCSIIWAQLDRGDLHRASQWADQFSRWTRRNNGFGYPGICRMHNGEVLCAQGNLVAAESEIRRARQLLSESARFVEGDACRVLGEIRLLRGDHNGADMAFRQAHELGWNPLPGWAILQAEQGRHAAAIRSLERALATPTWCDGQRRGIFLAHLARIAARAGRLEIAREKLAELAKAADLRSTPGCEALSRNAEAEVAIAEGDAERGIISLRASLAIWLEAGSRIWAAHTRLRLAEVLVQSGDCDEADLELTSAEKAFAKMEARPMLARCRAVRRTLRKATA